MRARDRTAAFIAAITGSVGKTSTKDMARLMLSRFGATHASVASYNNQWGVPLTLARMPASTRYGVFEIGMNHAGEIAGLVAQVRPHVAVVTKVARRASRTFRVGRGHRRRQGGDFHGPRRRRRHHQPRRRALRAPRRKRRVAHAGHVFDFGETEGAQARLLDYQTGRRRAARSTRRYSRPSPRLSHRRAGQAHRAEFAGRAARRARLRPRCREGGAGARRFHAAAGPRPARDACRSATARSR